MQNDTQSPIAFTPEEDKFFRQAVASKPSSRAGYWFLLIFAAIVLAFDLGQAVSSGYSDREKSLTYLLEGLLWFGLLIGFYEQAKIRNVAYSVIKKLSR